MKNVKRILTLLVVLAMVFTCVIALAACQPEEEDPNKKPPVGGDGGDSDIPTVDGKVTLYLTAEFGETPAEYVSIFFAGGANGWYDGTKGDAMNVSALTRLGETDTYYIQIALDNTADKWNEYKVGLGYNDKSPLPSDKWGMQGYGYTSDEAPSGLDNNTFKWDGSAKTVDLGTHHFNKAVPAPERANFTLAVRFSEPLGENAEVYFMGAFTNPGWNATAGKATLNEDRTVATLALTQVVIASYEYKVVVCEDATQIDPEHKNDADGNLDVWNALYKTDYKSEDGKPVRAFVEVNVGGENLSVLFTRLNRNATVYLAGTTAADADDPVAIDLSTAVVSEHQNSGVGDGTYDRKIDINATAAKNTVQFQIKFASAVAENLHVYLVGDFNTWEAVEMQANEDRTVFTVSIEMLAKDTASLLAGANNSRPDGKCQYKVIVSANDFSWEDTTRIDIGCSGDSDGGSTVLVQQGAKNFGQSGFTADGVNKLFDDATITLPAA